MKTRIFSRPHPPLPPPVCFTFFSMSLYDFFFSLLPSLIFFSAIGFFFTTVSMACYLLGFYVVALGRRGLTPLFGGACFIIFYILLLFFSPLNFFSSRLKKNFFSSLSLSLSLSLSFFFEVLIVHVLKSCISRKSVLRRE